MVSASFFDLLSRAIRLVSIAAVLILLGTLIGFLTDEVRDTSKVQATRIPSPGDETREKTVILDITQPNPPAAVERARENEHSALREAMDDAGDILLGPFTSLAEGSKPWVRRLLYSALGLFFYGFLLQVLADYIRRESDGSRRAARSAHDEQEARKRRESGTYASPS